MLQTASGQRTIFAEEENVLWLVIDCRRVYCDTRTADVFTDKVGERRAARGRQVDAVRPACVRIRTDSREAMLRVRGALQRSLPMESLVELSEDQLPTGNEFRQSNC